MFIYTLDDIILILVLGTIAICVAGISAYIGWLYLFNWIKKRFRKNK